MISYIKLFVLASIIGLTTTGVQGQVVSVFPSPQSLTAGIGEVIEVTFDRPMNPALFGAETFHVFGRWSGTAKGTFLFEEDSTRVRFVPDRPFMAGEWVTVAMSRSIEGQDGAPMEKGYAWSYWIKTAPGVIDQNKTATLSTRRDGEAGIRSYGAYAGDLNEDGFSDLMIPNEDANDLRVFLNNGAGGYSDFTVYPIPQGAVPSTNEGADFDLDGSIDFAVGNSRGASVSVWKGFGTGVVQHIENAPADEQVRGLCVLDLNGDAYMDMVTANRFGDERAGNLSLLLNDGAGHFPEAISIDAGAGGETACAAADANGDGIMDVFIGAHFSNEVALLLGDGEGGLQFSSKVSVGARPWMIVSGDVNGDGFADAVSVESEGQSMSVVLGDGAGGLDDARNYTTGLFPIAVDLGDLDGDGDLDAVTSNFSSSDFSVFENTGNGVFVPHLPLPSTSSGSCAILHDRDNDGDLDITAIDETDDLIFFFENKPSTVNNRENEPLTAFELLQNVPNPFSGQTEIRYTLRRSGRTSLTVYDMLGRKVRTLFDGHAAAGLYTSGWDGRDATGALAPAGAYYYALEANGSRIVRSMVRINQ